MAGTRPPPSLLRKKHPAAQKLDLPAPFTLRLRWWAARAALRKAKWKRPKGRHPQRLSGSPHLTVRDSPLAVMSAILYETDAGAAVGPGGCGCSSKRSDLKDKLKGTECPARRRRRHRDGGCPCFCLVGCRGDHRGDRQIKGRICKKPHRRGNTRCGGGFLPCGPLTRRQVLKLCNDVKEKYGHVDVLFNNATVTPMGSVGEVPVADWDKSYTVHLHSLLMLGVSARHEEADRGVGGLSPHRGLRPTWVRMKSSKLHRWSFPTLWRRSWRAQGCTPTPSARGL